MKRLPAYLTEPLRWARAEGWRPLYPKTRRDGLHTWVSQPKDPQARRYPPGTRKVAIDVAGLVTVQRMTRDGWVTEMVLTVGDGQAVVDVLAALRLLPRRYSAVYPLLRAQIREEVARDIEAAPDAVLPPSSVDRSRVAAIARGVATDGAEQMTVERAEARDEQED